ncbi:MAG TPA: hypothetical protein PLG31_14270 [Spirochaetota bacterium]|nr:hypothetical protein [Spirochaetota bacterium]
MDNISLLNELRGRITNRFGDIAERRILFGSRTQGLARDYSDYGILIVLKNSYDWRREDAIRDLCYDLCIEYGIVIDTKFISSGELNTVKGKQPFFLNAIETGISA